MDNSNDETIREVDEHIKLLNSKIEYFKKCLEKECDFRTLLLADKYNQKVYMKPKY